MHLQTNETRWGVSRFLLTVILLSARVTAELAVGTVIAAAALVKCRAVIDAGAPLGTLNAVNSRLLTLAKEKNIPVYIGWRAWAEKLEEQRHGA